MLAYVDFWRSQDRLMHSAVSILSPVIIHILMPALLMLSMVSLRLFCSLSSMAVIPSNDTPCSSSFMSRLITFWSMLSLL